MDKIKKVKEDLPMTCESFEKLTSQMIAVFLSKQAMYSPGEHLTGEI